MIFLRDQVPHVPGQEFFARVARELTANLVDLHKVTLQIGHKNADGRLLHQPPVTFLALLETSLPLFAPRDVAVVTYYGSHRRIIEQIRQDCFHPAPASVCMSYPTFN